MDVFKIKTGVSAIYPIDAKIFYKVTKGEKPYVVEKEKGKKSKQSHFAVCPECDNPIQIIGFYKNTAEAKTKPYGRHYPHSVPELALYNEDDYLNCKYSNFNWNTPKGKRGAASEVGKKILEMLKSDFDKIIAFFAQETGIYISEAFAKIILSNYIKVKGWEYRYSTPNNIPFSLLEANEIHTIFGRYIQKNGKLHNALLKKKVNIEFVDKGRYVQIQSKNNNYVDLNFKFINHRYVKKGETVTELIDMLVMDSVIEHDVVYEDTFVIDTEKFSKYMLNKGVKRNEKLLDFANSIIK